MALCYLLDEHLRGPLWHAIQQHNLKSPYPIDVLRVGDAPAPPLGTTDPDLLVWAEAQGRVLVTEDRQTMLTHLANHLQAGRHVPGIFMLRPNWKITQVVDYLVLAAHTGDPALAQDWVEFIP